MNWLARLKKLESAPATNLQNLQKDDTDAFVGFVGTCSMPFQKSAKETNARSARTALFMDRGLSADEAEAMAERLALRDKEHDERRLCLECSHLSGGASARQCSQWRQIGLMHGAAIPGELVTLLQRCAGFKNRLEVTL